MLRAVPGGHDEVITVQGRPGDRQRGGYPGRPVGVVRHPARPARHHRPVQAVLGLVGRLQQGLATGGRDGPGVLTACPDRSQDHPGRTQDQVGHRRGRPRPGLRRRVPSCRGHQVGKPAQRDPLAARGEQLQRGHVPAQPEIQRSVSPGTRCRGEPGSDPGRQGLLSAAQRTVLADLGQHRSQAADPRIQRIAIHTRPGRPPILRHHLGQPRATVLPDLTQNPCPRCLAQLPVNLASRHLSRLRRQGPHDVRHSHESHSHSGKPGHSAAPTVVHGYPRSSGADGRG